MSLRRRLGLVANAIFFFVSLSAACWAAERPEKTVLAFHVAELWTGDHFGLQVETLELVETTCPQEARRLLVHGCGEGRIVIDRVIEPPKGKSRIRISADVGKWSLTLTDTSNRKISVKNPSAYGGLLLWQQQEQIEGNWVMTRKFTLNGRKLGEVTSVLQDSGINERLLDVLRKSGAIELVAASIPSDIARLAICLDSIAASERGRGTTLAYLRPLLEIVAKTVRADGDGHEFLDHVHWLQLPRSGGGGVELVHGPLRDFVDAFQSVASPRDALGDLRGPGDGGCPAQALIE